MGILRKDKRAAVIFATLALLAVVAVAAAYGVFINSAPHFFSSNECFECHFTMPSGEDEPRPMRFNKPMSELCGRCHENLPRLSHVVDVVPSMKIPKDMPLNRIGMMTCATCHAPHMNRFDPKTKKKTYYLRTGEPGIRFCIICHEDPTSPGKVSIFSPGGLVTHRREMTRTHGFANFSVVDKDVVLDPLSLLCIGCHGKSEEAADLKKLGSGVWTHGGGIGVSHPIGVDYEDAAWNNREMVPIDDVDQRINFFDGRVGCCSCHNPYSPGGGKGLVIGASDSYHDLCLACHNL